ncbi:MAG: DUF1887 family protein [Lachnospiraceae bacterium]|nr:DUF1887 family protein [Lachnospiraceae bacterium]
MNVNIEFFVLDPIENLITCLNFKMDKVIYFGHSDVMTSYRQKHTARILREVCGVKAVEFHVVSQRNLQSVVEHMEEILKREEAHDCYFDLTGGEELIAVAMGILSRDYKTPMHLFDVESGKLHMLNKWELPGIEESVESRKIELTLDDIVGFRGGKISYRHQKMSKSNLDTEGFETIVNEMWEILKPAPDKWNGLAKVFQDCISFESDLVNVSIPQKKLKSILARHSQMGDVTEFITYLQRLEMVGAIKRLHVTPETIRYSYISEPMRECLLDAGCLLELRTYYNRKNTGRYSDCRVGVHIDWDGVFDGHNLDVENEIDVMLLRGNVATFISCKNGRVDQMALYELNTVADRFGGDYVQKELSVSQPLMGAYLRRAEEMNITVTKEE